MRTPKGFRHRMEIIRGSQNWSGNFWEFSERKTGNVPKLPLPLLLLFADENYHTENVLEHAENNFRGCRKCSGTFQNFSGKSFTENILSQREGTRSHESGVACLVAFCLGSTLVSRETCWWLVGGPPHEGGQACGRPSRGPLGCPLVPPL